MVRYNIKVKRNGIILLAAKITETQKLLTDALRATPSTFLLKTSAKYFLKGARPLC